MRWLRKRENIARLGLLCILGASVIAVARVTTLFSLTGKPWGILDEKFVEGVITSGAVIPFYAYCFPHTGALNFIEIKGRVFRDLKGSRPFFTRVKGSNYVYFVPESREELQHLTPVKVLYLADKATGDIRQITDGGDYSVSIISNTVGTSYQSAVMGYGGVITIEVADGTFLLNVSKSKIIQSSRRY